MENARLRRELSEALTRARAAERARSVFVSHVSRNIRAPLSSIAARAELLERAEIAPRLQKLAESLKVSAESAAALVAEILEFAQIEGAQDVRFPAPFHLEAAVRVAAAPYVTDASRRGLGFAIDIAPEAVGNFVGDGAHVQRMVDLLVADVVKRTQSGQVTVRLGLEEQAGVRMMFKLSVMSSDPAFVAAQPEEDGAAPLGVDLLVAHAIAQAIGSALNVETLPGGGGAFTAHVPLDLPMDEVSERRLAAR
jgi:signal transduction histidine kinase